MSNRDNLININDRPADEQLAIRQAGGRAAAKKRVERRELRERLTAILSQKVQRDDLLGLQLDEYEFDNDGTYYDKVITDIVSRSLQGEAAYTKILIGLLASGLIESE